jgi:methylamine dehydrogenase heavy chain
MLKTHDTGGHYTISDPGYPGRNQDTDLSRLFYPMSALLLLLACSGPSDAPVPDPIAPETLSVAEKVLPGPNLIVVASSWDGAGAITLFSADDLTYKGNYPTGLTAQLAYDPGKSAAYVASIFPERITYGPIHAWLQAIDLETLKTVRETEVPPRMAQMPPTGTVLAIGGVSGEWAFVQNATPATSVSVVDLASGALLSEIPNPGCWGAYPAPGAAKFSSLCGDGTIQTVKLTPGGQYESQASSARLFDAANDPLFTHAQRVDGDLVFVSFGGRFLRVSDAGDVAVATDDWTFVDATRGKWAPGGFQLTSYSADAGVMFVLMHKDPYDGSHKNNADEVWAIDLKTRKVLHRSKVEPMNYMSVSAGEAAPVLFGVNSESGEIYRYELDPASGFAARLTGSTELHNAGYLIAP